MSANGSTAIDGGGAPPEAADDRTPRSDSPSSRIDGGRRAGSFSRQAVIAWATAGGSAALTSETHSGAWVRIEEISAAADSPRNGRRPVAISNRTTPSENTSER